MTDGIALAKTGAAQEEQSSAYVFGGLAFAAAATTAVYLCSRGRKAFDGCCNGDFSRV